LSKDGILPTTLRYGEGDQLTNKQIYPYAICSYGSRQVVVNLLEEQVPGIPEEVVLNNAVSLLEYKFSNAIQKLTLDTKPNIVFTEGQGELERQQTARLESLLREYYNTGRMNLDSTYQINPEIDLVVVAKPRTAFDQRDQFLLDQYIMNGGSIMWLIDQLNVNVDSIGRNQVYIPTVYESGLEDLWFKYGFRIQPNLVLDLESSSIPQVIGMAGDKPQMELIKWPYHVLSFPLTNHPIAKNLGRVNLFFPSTIDTIKTATPIDKYILLKSSPYTRYQLSPVRLNFQILQEDFRSELFNKAPQPLAVLLEGEFESAFKNRVGQDMLSVLDQIGVPFKDRSPRTQQLVVSDGDIANNVLNVKEQKIYPLGYNKFERKTYSANETFLLNAVEYMLDEKAILTARSKEVKLRLLDTVKARSERTKWRFINIGMPILLLLLFGGGYRFMRKRKYGAV
jgi:ABC-2 type transport system permease protein